MACGWLAAGWAPRSWTAEAWSGNGCVTGARTCRRGVGWPGLRARSTWARGGGAQRTWRTQWRGVLARDPYLWSLARWRSLRQQLARCAFLFFPLPRNGCAGMTKNSVEERDRGIFGFPLDSDVNWVFGLGTPLDRHFFHLKQRGRGIFGFRCRNG
jgi:hypothetical protein